MNVDKCYYTKWRNRWESQTEEVLEATALIRALECTNGCIQHAFRGESENALPLEETRECMKLSMGTIKNKVLPLPDGTEVVLPEECHPIMNEARDLYVRGFKQNDKDAMEEFLALSKAHFKVLGRTVIDEKFRFVDEHFVDLFTPYWLMMGRAYIYSMGEFTV